MMVAGGAVAGAAGAAGTTAAGGSIEWTYEADQHARTAATVVGGTVYVGMSDQPSHRLHVIDADTGDHQEELFQNRPITAASVVNDIIFVAQDGGDAAVEAYDAATYDRLYSVDMEYAPSTQPVVFDGMVYLGSEDGVVYALDAWTGEREWLFEADDSVDSTPLVADGIVYVGCNDEHLYALDAETGTEEWAFEADGPIRSSPTIADGTVYVGEVGSRLLAVDAADGDLSWEYPLQSTEVSASPTIADGTVYIGDWEGYMYAVDAGDGSEQWTLDVTEEERANRGDGERVRSSPTVADGLVFVFSDDGYLYAIDAERGDIDWRFDTETPIGLFQHAPSPTVVDGTVYFSNDTTVYAIDAGLSGAGSGSRMQYGTLGHHDVWAETAAAADRPSIEEIEQPRDVGGTDDSDDGESDGDSDGDEESSDAADGGFDDSDSASAESVPGFGVVSAAAGVGGASYLLARRGTTEDER